MTQPTQFWLKGEGGELATPRRCTPMRRVRDPVRDHMIVEIDPPLVGQRYGLGARDISVLLLSLDLRRGRRSGGATVLLPELPSGCECRPDQCGQAGGGREVFQLRSALRPSDGGRRQ